MKNWLKKDRASGFTIIEVMIVLAIAGLIMVIVFIAIPQLQRNQRDNARQNLANRVEAEMETYAGNNQGQYPVTPATLTTFTNNYFNSLDRRNPKTGANYTLAFATDYPTQEPTENEVLVYRGGKCNGERAEAAPGTPTTPTSTDARSIALRVQLDRGTTFYCVDNS